MHYGRGSPVLDVCAALLFRVAFACLNEVHGDFTRNISMPVWVRAGSQGQATKSSKSNHPDIHYQERLAEILKKYKVR